MWRGGTGRYEVSGGVVLGGLTITPQVYDRSSS